MRSASTTEDTEPSKGKRQSGPERSARSILQPGERAPDFSLKTTPDQQVALHDFLGQPVVLVFYPADWSPVCTDQLSLYTEIMPEFRKFNAEILAISVDGIWGHLAFAKDRKLAFPLLSDFEPKGSVSQAYGAYDHAVGESTRSLFVIDSKGVVVWSHLSPDGINPGADGILAALENIGGTRHGKKKEASTR
jgi:peroxiredoxin